MAAQQPARYSSPAKARCTVESDGQPGSGAGSVPRRHAVALLSRARALLGLAGGPPDRLAPGELKAAAKVVSALHEGLIGERTLSNAATYGVREHLGAYLLWWWPQSYAKVRAALRLLPEAPPAGARVLDLGAGPGPGALAALDHLRELHGEGVPSEVLATDASEPALAEARALAGGGALRTQRFLLGAPQASADAAIAGRFELLLASNVLSELPLTTAQRARAAADLAERNLASGGVLLLLEPALRETGRALLEVRDALVATHGLRAVAPCLTQRPCPALAAPRDWCTAARPWQAPPHLVQLARELGLRADEELSFAFVALSAPGTPMRERPADLFRVVGLPPREKGKKRIFVCNDLGRLPASRLDREETPANASFAILERGDLVQLRGLSSRGDGLRVGAASTVERK
ncbi:MAG TPA: small ribosomal subunit Rsm22 family protein [Myxococcales bacterium]|nr:small ribosomal subunit Rsm22 family protein [Myxococcales bacterium]